MSTSRIFAKGKRTVALIHRRLLLLRPRADHLQPGGEERRGLPSKVLVLQSAPNATVDYFLRPRLQAAGGPAWEVVNTTTPPNDVPLLQEAGLLVIVCRYITPSWLQALERRAGHLHGLIFLVDDDLPAMLNDHSIPASARGRILRDYARHQARLGRIASGVWVTSPALAQVLPRSPDRILEARPTEAPPDPARTPPKLVVYHGGPTHERERLFVLEVARQLGSYRPDIRFEIADPRVKRQTRWATNVDLVPYLDWNAYCRAQQGREAAVMLAPLFDTPVNRARAPVKFFDAARIGAAGVYADTAAYADFVRSGHDGLLVPMEIAKWLSAIERLVDDEGGVRLRLALAAFERVTNMRGSTEPLG